MAQQHTSGHDFAACLLDGLKGEPALTPTYLIDLEQPSWPLVTGLLADFAHLFAIVTHGWAGAAEQIAGRVGETLGFEEPAAALAEELFGGSVIHADAIRQLAIAVGPTRLRAGLTTAEAAASAHRGQMQILLESERLGCALGAAATVAVSWCSLVTLTAGLLEKRPAGQSAIVIPGLTDGEAVSVMPSALTQSLAGLGRDMPARRGILFGISQALALRAAFWSMLAERAQLITRKHI